MFEPQKDKFYYDKLFVKHLVKECQRLDPSVGAVFFPETKQVVFYWNRLIVGKIMLDERNLGIQPKEHAKKIHDTIRYVKAGLIPVNEIRPRSAGFNRMRTGKILT